MPKKRRSLFWVVSTHVLTTGLAIPALVGIVAAFVISLGNFRDPLTSLYLLATFTVLAYAGGTLYSLSYLRKVADCDNWTRCTMPSVVTFAILNVMNCAWNVYSLNERSAFSIGVLAASSLVSIVAFAVLTSSGFARMSRANAALQAASASAEPAASSEMGRSKLKRRLIAAGVGLVAGFAVGIGISIYMGGGRQAPGAWQNHLLTAAVVGGIGSLLGLVSGIPQN